MPMVIRQRLLDANDVQGNPTLLWSKSRGVNRYQRLFWQSGGRMVGAGREGAGGALYVTAQTSSGLARSIIRDRSRGNRTDLLAAVPILTRASVLVYRRHFEKGDATGARVYILSTDRIWAIAASRPVYDAQHNLLGVSFDGYLSGAPRRLSETPQKSVRLPKFYHRAFRPLDRFLDR